MSIELSLNDILDAFFTFAATLGYLGIFAMSFIASIILFIPVPFFPILAIMSIDKSLDPHMLAFSSAVGATLAKTIIFYSSYYGRRLIRKERRLSMKPLQRLFKRYGWYASFIAAATPIPDDMVYIPLGLAKYNPWLFFTSCLAGKMVISEAIVWGSRMGLNFFEHIESDSATTIYATVAAAVVITGVSVYLMIRVDWGRVVGRIFKWTLDDRYDNNDNDNYDNK